MSLVAIGQITWQGPSGTLVRDLTRCAHCHYTWPIDPDGPSRPFCRKCYGPECGREGCVKECVPAEKVFELYEAASRYHTQMPLACVHCHTTWIPVPGSGRERGWCTDHEGPICGAKRCKTHPDRVKDFRWLFEKVLPLGQV